MGRSQASQAAVTRVLAGDGAFDLLTEREQVVVQRVWADRMEVRRRALDYAARFAAAGESFSEADSDGKVVLRPPLA